MLKPRQEEFVKDLLVKDGEIIGYLTGYSVFNRLGLTTQVPNIIQIGTNTRKNKKQRGLFTISFVLQTNPITKENIPLLQLLDAIRFIKEIPDATIDQSCKRLVMIIRDLDTHRWFELYWVRWLKIFMVHPMYQRYGIR